MIPTAVIPTVYPGLPTLTYAVPGTLSTAVVDLFPAVALDPAALAPLLLGLALWSVLLAAIRTTQGRRPAAPGSFSRRTAAEKDLAGDLISPA